MLLKKTNEITPFWLLLQCSFKIFDQVIAFQTRRNNRLEFFLDDNQGQQTNKSKLLCQDVTIENEQPV